MNTCHGNCNQGRACTCITQPMVFEPDRWADEMEIPEDTDSEGGETDTTHLGVKLITLVLVAAVIGAVVAIMGDSLVRIATRGWPW